MAQPGYPAQVRSSLLGPYRDPSQMIANARSWNTSRTGTSTTGGSPQYTPLDVGALAEQYRQRSPDINITTDTGKLYENMAAGFRGDAQNMLNQAGQQAISTAAQTGREVADVVARYLPEAVRGYGAEAGKVAASAGQLAQQGQIAVTEAKQAQQAMANQMAQFEAAQAQQQWQFVRNLETQYQMHREQLDNNLAIARTNATTQREIAQAEQAYNMEINRMNQQYQQAAMQYKEQQANARQAAQLQLYDQYWGAQQGLANQQFNFDVYKWQQQQAQQPQFVLPTTNTNVNPTQGVQGGAVPQAGTGTFSYGTPDTQSYTSGYFTPGGYRYNIPQVQRQP